MRNPVTLIAWITALFFVPSFTFAGTIGETKINPDTTPAGVPVAATVTATIPDSDLIGGSVNLQRLDASGNATTILGTLHDDGVNGDAVANDKIYSLVTTILENTPGAVRFRVSAAFRGTLLRAFSSPLTVNITGTATDITIVAPATAAYLNTSPVTVRGTVGDVAATVTVNGVAAPVAGGTFVATVPLNEGPNTLTAVAINSNGSTSTASALVTLDTTPPRVAIYTPTTNGITTDATVTVTGSLKTGLRSICTGICGSFEKQGSMGRAGSCSVGMAWTLRSGRRWFHQGDRKAHRSHESRIVHLLAGVDFDFVSAGAPAVLGGKEFEVSGLILQRDVHRIFGDDRAGQEAHDLFGVAPAEDLKGLIVLVQFEHDEDRLGAGGELFGRPHRDNLMSPANPQLLIEPFGNHDFSEHALRRGIKTIGLRILRAVLEFRNRYIVGQGQLVGLGGWSRHEEDAGDESQRESHSA